MRFIARLRLTWVCLLVIGLVVAPAVAQDNNSPTKQAAELKVGSVRVGKILFLGNSITLHGPAPQIGWTGNWGMAASSREKDYVHLLTDRISKAVGATPQIKVRNIADFERNHVDFNFRESLKEELKFAADLVIVAIGENVPALTTDDAQQKFGVAMAKLLAELKQHGNPTIVVRNQFWPNAVNDQLMKQACLDAGGVFVDLDKIGLDPANSARSERQIEHDGVAGHPGDRGMAAIADRMWTEIQKRGNAKP